MSLVYVIDDDTGLRTAYAAALSKLGYEVQVGTDGNQALALVEKKQPDLILLDMLMPNLDGVGFLQTLRSRPGGQDIKVVVVSNIEDVSEAQNLGVAKYLSKLKFGPEQVADAVDKLLKPGA